MIVRAAGWCASLLLVFAVSSAHSLPVFPGAIGFGTDTKAGRDAQWNATHRDIYVVDTLEDDSYSNPSPGTLRYGIEKIARPRIIVFEVSGVIELKRDLIVRAQTGSSDFGFLTIAGQTAPFPGITLKNGGIRIYSHDVLIQHIGIRPGNHVKGDEELPVEDRWNDGWELTRVDNRDCIGIEGTSPHHIVVDHVSCSWTTDEQATIWASGGTGSDITFSNNLFADPIQFGGHSKSQHGYGLLAGVGAEKVSYIRNVMAFNWERNPLIRDRTKGAQIVNNLIYRPGPGAGRAIAIGSYAGHDTTSPADDLMTYPTVVSAIGNVVVRAPTLQWDGATQNGSARGFYIRNNTTTNLTTYLSGNYSYDAQNDIWYPLAGQNQYSSPFFEDQHTTVPNPNPSYPSYTLTKASADPYANSGGTVWEPMTGSHEFLRWRIKHGAGKSPVRRDAIDESLTPRMSDMRDTTSTWLETFDPEANPWSAVDIRERQTFQMPDDPTGDADGDGYKNIEEELHRLAAIAEGRGTDGSSAVFDAFNDGDANGWTTNVAGATGSWSIVNNALKQTNNALNARAVLSGTDFDDQVVQARVTIDSFSGSGFAAVYGRFNAFDHTYYMTLRSTGLLELKRTVPNGTAAGAITTFATAQLDPNSIIGVQHTLRLEINGNLLKGYVNGTKHVEATDLDEAIWSGRAAVGCYLAAVSFDEVFASRLVDAKPYVNDDFDDGTIGSWVTAESGLSGSWTVTAGEPSVPAHRVLNQTLDNVNARAVWTSTRTNQSTQARIKVANFGGNGFVAVYARYTDMNNAYYVTLRSSRVLELKKITSSGVVPLGTLTLPSTFPLDAWHTLRLDVSDFTDSGVTKAKLHAYLDGELRLTATDASRLTSGKGGVGTYLAAAAFDDIVLTAP